MTPRLHVCDLCGAVTPHVVHDLATGRRWCGMRWCPRQTTTPAPLAPQLELDATEHRP